MKETSISPPIWFREVADGGAHLDAPTIGHMAGIIGALARIARDGHRRGRFEPVAPLLVHAGIVGPLLLFFASDGIRRRLEKGGIAGAAQIGRDQVVAHVQAVALGTLEGRMA